MSWYDRTILMDCVDLQTSTKLWHLVWPNTEKTLKISVFGGSRWYLVLFGFANSHSKYLVFFDLQIVISKVFGIFWFANSYFKSIWKNLDLVFIGSRKPNNISKFLPWISDRLIILRLKIHVLKTIQFN